MKKFFSILLIVVMMCSMLSLTAFAAPDPVISPEHENSDTDPNESSPQTGYPIGIAGVAVIALACGAVAVVSTRKARK